jgi:hypothetical protein
MIFYCNVSGDEKNNRSFFKSEREVQVDVLFMLSYPATQHTSGRFVIGVEITIF